MSLDMAICVAQGDQFLGFAAVKCDVLYLALEDPRRRIKTRAWKLLDETSGNVDFAVAAEKVASGLIPQIEDYLAEHPATKLVIIDTFQMGSRFQERQRLRRRLQRPHAAQAAGRQVAHRHRRRSPHAKARRLRRFQHRERNERHHRLRRQHHGTVQRQPCRRQRDPLADGA